MDTVFVIQHDDGSYYTAASAGWTRSLRDATRMTHEHARELHALFADCRIVALSDTEVG